MGPIAKAVTNGGDCWRAILPNPEYDAFWANDHHARRDEKNDYVTMVTYNRLCFIPQPERYLDVLSAWLVGLSGPANLLSSQFLLNSLMFTPTITPIILTNSLILSITYDATG